MKRSMMLAMALVMLFLFTLAEAYDTKVQGHWKDTNRDGFKDSYVDSYHRTSPNNTKFDNYGTRGNYNPYTGKQGTENPYSNPYETTRKRNY